MKWDGIEVRYNKRYGWRNANPETDVDIYGDPVPSNHVVLVKMADCEIVTKDDGRKVYLSKGVKQAIRLAYYGTHYGGGKPRNRIGGGSTIPYYLVYDGHVYSGTIRRTK
jgi:hypothetical protein